MVSLDLTLGIQIVNFLVLILVLNLLLYKPILGIIEKRNRQLEDSQAEIGRLQETVEQKMAAYEEKLRIAKMHAVERKSEIIRQGSEEAKSVLDAVRGEIPGMMQQFQERIDEEVGAAERILSDRSRKLSVEIAEKVLGRSLR